jgi:hypothetical protein
MPRALPVGRAHHQPALRFIDIQIGRHDVEVTREHDGRTTRKQLGRMLLSLSNHLSLYSNFGPGAGLPLGR